MSHPLKEGWDHENWRTLPEICMALHMRHTGADETLTDEQYAEAVEYLKDRTLRWSPFANGPTWAGFDTAVLSMCLATLDESSRHVVAKKVHASS